MLDFLVISTRPTKSGTEIYPIFRTYPKSKDLMFRGGDFYAIWDETAGIWSTDEDDAKRLIDIELDKYLAEHKTEFFNPIVKYMWNSKSGSIDDWHKFCQKQMRNNFKTLDQTIIFANDEVNKLDYASKRLTYPLEPGTITAYDKLISTLYSEEERHKIEWAIGAIVTGDSKTIQKFMVLYGEAGAGKSTIMNVIQMLFDGYYAVFDAKALGSASDQFALEVFKNSPLVGIQHDGDLSRIEDNTRLNSLISHEEMVVNEKHAKRYTSAYNTFLIMGSNKPVKITDAKSGIIRRLIDVTPSGNRLDIHEYNTVMRQIPFELGAIAHHCKEIYLANPHAYDDYQPISMIGATNDFYNFMLDSFSVFKKEDGTTLKAAWEMYKTYCDDAKVPFPMALRNFKEELRNYFEYFDDKYATDEGTTVRSYYRIFRLDKFDMGRDKKKQPEPAADMRWLIFDGVSHSILDDVCADYPAQLASSKETPKQKWEEVLTKLSDIDTSLLHYVKVPENHIVIDFDLKDEDGKKSFEKNLKEASKWPATYAELSKSGGGIHLHYIYTGDVSKLSRVYSEGIEVKVFTGKSSLRRKLSKCNNLPIATINSGLPLKEEEKMVSRDVVITEKGLRTTIKKCINKEVHASTKCSVDFIYKVLEDAYNDGLHYDVSDMYDLVFAFAASSTNQADYCIKLVGKMRFKSEDVSEAVDNEGPIIFYDVEVFPNLFLVNWKAQGEGKPVVRMINPKPAEIEALLKYRLVGFNNRRYDNHMLYARWMGYSNEGLYNLSQRIISGDRNAFFGEAYNLSYTDIYDFSAKKQSLKKWEIELNIHHQELGLPWDQPVPEERWIEVAEYCDNDVIATEAVWNHLAADFTARQLLADLSGGTVNDTTNSLTTKLIFGKERKPQSQFKYRNLAEPVFNMDEETYEFLSEVAPEMMAQTHGEDGSYLPYFPGYEFKCGKSTYKGVEVGEGGRVFATPGIHLMVALLDVVSMHPHSTLAECLFGPRFTRAFRDIVYGRVNIKHEAWEIVNEMLDGKLRPYIQKVLNGELQASDLAYALKIAINSVYGLTAAKFDNPFRDPRNIDNIVAKRGALFMVDLQEEVEKRGFTVAHIKTDSIKIPNATPEIIQFVMDFGKKYGYTFEHEATYEKMCLVNDAVYIAKYATKEQCEEMYDYIPGDNKKHPGKWTATGKQFAVPYVHKTLFSKEPIEFDDMCETFSVKSALYLDMNEQLPDVTMQEKELEKLEKKYKEGKLSDTTFETSSAELSEAISKGHDYNFIGKVGSFCPIKSGRGGGWLMREQNGKYYAATGTTGFRWSEAELIKGANEDAIDTLYYKKLVDDAVDTISQYGDFEWFISDDPVPLPEKPWDFMNIPENSPDYIPFR